MDELSAVQSGNNLICHLVSYHRLSDLHHAADILGHFKTLKLKFGYLNRLMLMHWSQMKTQNSNFHLLPSQFSPSTI